MSDQKNDPNKIGFLVIQLKTGDSFTLGHDVLIHVKERRGDFFRLAIRAPKSLRIERKPAEKV